MNQRAVFLTWNDSRRSRSLAGKANIPLVIFVADLTGVVRHVLGAIRTIFYLLCSNPRVVWFQYSLVLAAVLAAYRACRPWKEVILIADVHTKALRREGVRPFSWLVRMVKRLSLRSCGTVLVTNRQNQDYARERYGVDARVLIDPLPDIPACTRDYRAPIRFPSVVFVCSFAVDEPLGLIATVADLLGPEYHCAVTGDPSRLRQNVAARLQYAADLTGFLPDDRYWKLLSSAAVIVVATNDPACLPCGAYEALAVGRRPVLLTDDVAQEVFGTLAIFTDPVPSEMAAVIAEAAGAAGHIELADVNRFRTRWERAWASILDRSCYNTTMHV